MKLTICVPYRNRESHLKTFLNEIDKHTDAQIVIVEQADNKPFNRGALCNIGFNFTDTKYFCIHDVDMIPEHVDYSCLYEVYHLATMVKQFKYSMPYPQYFGGVTMFRRDVFQKINGFNNNYFGWGAEDDDLRNRVLHYGFDITRLPNKFDSLPHTHATQVKENKPLIKANQNRLLKWNEEMHIGLTTLDYKIESVNHTKNIYHIKALLP